MTSIHGNALDCKLDENEDWRHEHLVHSLRDDDACVDIDAITIGVEDLHVHRGISWLDLTKGGPSANINAILKGMFIEAQNWSSTRLANFEQVICEIIRWTCKEDLLPNEVIRTLCTNIAPCIINECWTASITTHI